MRNRGHTQSKDNHDDGIFERDGGQRSQPRDRH